MSFFLDDLGQLLLLEAVRYLDDLLDDVVGPEGLLALPAGDHGVGEAAHVAGSLEDRLDADGRRLDLVEALAHAVEPPPLVLDLPLERGAERPVVVKARRPAVDLERRPDEAPVLRELEYPVKLVHGETSMIANAQQKTVHKDIFYVHCGLGLRGSTYAKSRLWQDESARAQPRRRSSAVYDRTENDLKIRAG